MRKKVFFDDIPADKCSFSITAVNLKNEVIGRNFTKEKKEGATLKLTLLFYKEDIMAKAFELLESLKKVTFCDENFDYDCNLLSIDEFSFSDGLLTVVITYACEIYGREYVFEIKPSDTFFVQGEQKTPLIVEVFGQGIVTVGKNTFEITENGPLVIDSLEMRVTGGKIKKMKEWFFIKGKYNFETSGNIQKMKVRYRKAYVNY